MAKTSHVPEFPSTPRQIYALHCTITLKMDFFSEDAEPTWFVRASDVEYGERIGNGGL
jgi:hypothetical protein